MTIVTDPSLYHIIFFPDNKHITSNQEALGAHWFGIDKTLIERHQTTSLAEVRRALKQSKSRALNNHVGAGILAQMRRDFGDAGTADLMSFAELTFWPVNEAMWGEEVVSARVCPHLKDELANFNADFEKVANGMPRKAFPEMERAAQAITSHFDAKITAGFDEAKCPILTARLKPMENDPDLTNAQKARAVMSIYWAAQANTLPATFWALSYVLNDPVVLGKSRPRGAFGAFCESAKRKRRVYHQDASVHQRRRLGDASAQGSQHHAPQGAGGLRAGLETVGKDL